MKFVRSSLIPFSMPPKTCRNPRDRERSFSSPRSPLMDFRETRSEQREPNRLLRMQDPFPSSFSEEKDRCSCRPGAGAHPLISPPPDRPSERCASPSVSPPCAPEQPWSSHAWRPSPPSVASHGPSQPWHGGSIQQIVSTRKSFTVYLMIGLYVRAQQGHACA